MIIKNGTTLNGVPVDSTSILEKGRVVTGTKITPTHITIHNTSNPNATAENHRKFLLNHNKAGAGGAITSWHFTVDDVKIVQHLDTRSFAYHAGTSVGNKTSIGIEVTEFTSAAKQAKAIENAKILVRHIMNEEKISLSNVGTHKDWSGKNCPRVILAEEGGFEAFRDSIPTTISVNGITSTVKKSSKPQVFKEGVAPNVATVTVDEYSFKATDSHIGVVEVTYKGNVNIRQKADLTSTVVKTTKTGQAWKVYAITNGLYKIGEGQFITSNKNYVKFVDNPYLDNNGKSLPKEVAASNATGVTSTKATTKLLKVKVDNLFTYNSADWNDKGKKVNKGEVFTVVKELVVKGAKMYQLKSGVFITASTKYVELV